MPRGLTRLHGRCEYNGYVFNDTTRTTAIRIVPVPDSSGRTTVYNEWSITLRWYVSATSTTDAAVADAISRLSHRGKTLVYRGRGLGNPDVNTGAVKDLKWGPEPGPVTARVLGTGNAVELMWSVTFRLPNCPEGKYEFANLEFNYRAEFTVDDAGFTTRTITGHLVVPITWRPAGRQLVYSADEFRLLVAPPKLRKFRRTFGPFVLSEDRTRLDFSITDAEMGGDPLPPNVVEARVSESVGSTQTGLRIYTWTVNGSYRLRRGATGLDAARAFFDLVGKRVKNLQATGAAMPRTDSKGNPLAPPDPIPLAFSMTNPDHYGKPAAEFSMSFSFTNQLATILELTGLWKRLDQQQAYGEIHTWEGWADSLADTAFHPYGGIRFRFLPADDVLTDLCDVKAELRSNPDAEVKTAELRGGRLFDRPSLADPKTDPKNVVEMIKTVFQTPKPESSWLSYQNELFLELDNGVVPVSIIPQKVLRAADDVLGQLAQGAADVGGRAWNALQMAGGVLPIVAGGLVGPGIPGGRLETSTGTETVRRVRASCFVYLRGYATRAGYPVDPPRLIDVDGIEAVPANRFDRGEGFAKGVMANGEHPIHYCRWNLRYSLPRVPDKPLPTPPNPQQGGVYRTPGTTTGPG